MSTLNGSVINSNAILLAEQYNTCIRNIVNSTRVYQTNIRNVTNTTNQFNIQLNSVSHTAAGLNNELSKTGGKTSAFDKMKDKLKEVISVQNIAKKGFEMMGKGLNTATELQKSEQLMGAVLGDTKVGSSLFNHIAQQAKGSSLSIEDMAANTQKFLGVTRSVEDIDKLNNMSEKLTRLNTTGQDAKGSGAALNKAMQGDYSDLTKGFNIDESAIKNSGFEDAVNTGNMTEAIGILDNLISKSGYSQEALDGMVGNLSIQWEMFTKKISEDFGMAMRIVADTLAPAIQKLNELSESGAFQPFINAFVLGINLIAMGLDWLIDTFVNGWNIIGPILGGVVIAYLAYMAAQLWSMIAPLVTQLSIWLTMNWPILMIIAAVAMMGYMLGQMGVTGEEVCGIIVGSFYALYAVIYNIIMGIGNFAIAAAEAFENTWNKSIVEIKNFFIDLAIVALKNIAKITSALDSAFGSNLTNSINAKIDILAASKEGAPKEVKYDRLEYKNVGENYLKGHGKGVELYNTASSTLDDLMSKLGSLGNPGDTPVQVEGVGGGNVPVDVAEDDVQYLKDIAERDYINKYSSATLAPNIQVSFGDVKETADADKLAQHIQYILQEQIAIVAEGAY